MKKSIGKQCFVDCEDIKENTVIYNFYNNVLKLGKSNLSDSQLNRIGLILSTDLKNFAELCGNTSNLTANSVYTHLRNNQ